MRDILFRGKSESTNKWVYGGYEEMKDINVLLIHRAENYVSIHPETVGQYTGLDDKNGVKIFEGDIVESDNGYVGDVQFSHGVFGVEWVRCKQNRDMVGREGALHNLRKLDDGFNAKMRVIGNIHDNPELLEAENE